MFIGNMNVLLTIGSDSDHNAFLELFLARFEKKASAIRSACQSRRSLGDLDKETDTLGDQSLDAKADSNETLAASERRLYSAWDGEFHPYVWHLLTGSQYYFRYRGSWVEPPCLEDLTAEWRVMKEPIKMSRDQFDRLDAILYQRLNPSTCVRESSGRLRKGSTYKRDFNRPIQTTTDMHNVTYCECIDFSSGYPKDLTYCAKSMNERGVFPFQG